MVIMRKRIIMKFFIIIFMMYLVNRDSVVQAKLPDKLTNGRPTTLIAHPYHVSVYFDDHVMGTASIISSRHMLTTASCVLLEEDRVLSVASNLYILTGSNGGDNTRGVREFYQVYVVIWHENYMPRRFWRNDIAILQLDRELTFLPTRSKIELPTRAVRYNAISYLVNWGNDQSSTNDDKYLQHTYVAGQKNADCQKIFPNFSFNYRTQGCGKIVFFSGSTMTFGDVGAALVYTNQVIGIVSAIFPDKPQFVIYTKVYSYLGFIDTALTIY